MSNVNTDLEVDLMSLQAFQLEIEKLYKWAHHGCSDGGCQIEVNKGMHTNGGCQCNPRNFAEHLLWLACEAEKHGRKIKWPTTSTATQNKDLDLNIPDTEQIKILKEQVAQLRRDLAYEEQAYQALARHHNVNCMCSEIY